jgi:hypothetical protein
MKDFVPYKESLELKSLGFDEPCFGIYQKNKKVNIGKVGSPPEFPKNPTCWNCSAPTFSQSFRFFREKYGLECVIDINTKFINNFQPVEKLYKIQIIKSDEYSTERHNKLLDTKLNIASYEEAELECLRKLIEYAKAN